VEDETKLVSRLHGRQDDSARRATLHVKACRVNRRGGHRQPGGLRLPAKGADLIAAAAHSLTLAAR